MPRHRQATRAHHYGINANALARDAATKLPKLRAKIAALGEAWGDADPLIERATETALQAVDDLLKQVKESAEYMNEPMDE